MASDQATVDVIVEQASRGNAVRARKMFGEYGVYCDERFVGIVADDRLFLKITDAGAASLPGAAVSRREAASGDQREGD
jgi:TfoX/Sxy family transcriptional regulator of competence genes